MGKLDIYRLIVRVILPAHDHHQKLKKTRTLRFQLLRFSPFTIIGVPLCTAPFHTKIISEPKLFSIHLSPNILGERQRRGAESPYFSDPPARKTRFSRRFGQDNLILAISSILFEAASMPCAIFCMSSPGRNLNHSVPRLSRLRNGFRRNRLRASASDFRAQGIETAKTIFILSA